MLIAGNNYPQSYPVVENMLVNTNFARGPADDGRFADHQQYRRQKTQRP